MLREQYRDCLGSSCCACGSCAGVTVERLPDLPDDYTGWCLLCARCRPALKKHTVHKIAQELEETGEHSRIAGWAERLLAPATRAPQAPSEKPRRKYWRGKSMTRTRAKRAISRPSQAPELF